MRASNAIAAMMTSVRGTANLSASRICLGNCRAATSAQPSSIPQNSWNKDKPCHLRVLRLLARGATGLCARPRAAWDADRRDAGFSLVFGGGNVGLMGEVARAAHAAGARGAGRPAGIPAPSRTAAEDGRGARSSCPTCSSARRSMLALADAFIVLPGGLGTFDEFFEVLSTRRSFRCTSKPIVLVNTEGYLRSAASRCSRTSCARVSRSRSIENLYRIRDDAGRGDAICRPALGRCAAFARAVGLPG